MEALDQALADASMALVPISRWWTANPLVFPPPPNRVLRTDRVDDIYYRSSALTNVSSRGATPACPIRRPTSRDRGDRVIGQLPLPRPPGPRHGHPPPRLRRTLRLHHRRNHPQARPGWGRPRRRPHLPLIFSPSPPDSPSGSASATPAPGRGHPARPARHGTPAPCGPLDALAAPARNPPAGHRIQPGARPPGTASAAQQRFVANAAHRLRTPLAGIRTQLELLLREADD